MKKIFVGIGIFILVILGLIGLSFGTGMLDVFYTKTVGKAKQNAETVVYQESNAYVNGKRQEALKYYREYAKAESIGDKQAIRELVMLSFAEFDESKLKEPIRSFIEDCKY